MCGSARIKNFWKGAYDKEIIKIKNIGTDTK